MTIIHTYAYTYVHNRILQLVMCVCVLCRPAQRIATRMSYECYLYATFLMLVVLLRSSGAVSRSVRWQREPHTHKTHMTTYSRRDDRHVKVIQSRVHPERGAAARTGRDVYHSRAAPPPHHHRQAPYELLFCFVCVKNNNNSWPQ